MVLRQSLCQQRLWICCRSIHLISFLVFIANFLFGHSDAAPTSAHIYTDASSSELSETTDPVNGPGHYFEATVVSIGLLLTFVIFLILCSGSCCLNVFGKRRREDTVGSFNNPIADFGGNSISPIDVRALALDPVVFEPLPSINELTPSSYSSLPRSNAFHHFRHHSSAALPSHHYAEIVTTAIVPTDETNVYAHDWFDEPYRNFPRGNIVFEKEVGKAWFGKVIEAEAEDIVPYAKKLSVIVKVLREDATGSEQMRFLDESRVYRDVNHGNVLKLLGHSIETLPFLLLMEHCPQGDLKSFLIANVTRAELLNAQGALVRMALDVAKGLEGMASANFIHKDLAARNCQVGSEGRVIIGDYGTQAQMFCDDYYWGSNIAIPLRWCAPETLHCTINTIQTLKVLKSSNVWTFGIVLWEICEFGKLPYFELTDDDVLSRVVTEKNYTLGIPSRAGLSMKDELFKIMLSCWNPQQENRPTISSIVDQLETIYSNMKMTGSPIMSPTMSQHATVIASGLKSPSTDDFDKKWNEFGSTTNSSTITPNEEDSSTSWKHEPKTTSSSGNSAFVSKKKSVSFVGMDDDDIPLVQIKSSTSGDNLQHNQNIETQSNSSINFDKFGPLSAVNIAANGPKVVPSSSSYQSESLNNKVLPPIVTSNSYSTVDDESELKLKNENLYSDSFSTEALLKEDDCADAEDEKWRQRIEQGEISKKVREKSQSVQDLMVLTRIEPSELSDPDPDSLIIVSDSLMKKYGSGSALEFSSNMSPLNFNLSSNETNGGKNLRKKSNSETALNSFSLLSSSSPPSSIVQSNGVYNNSLNNSQYSGEDDTVQVSNVIISDSHTKNSVLTPNFNNSMNISNSNAVSVAGTGDGSGLVTDREFMPD